MYIINLGESLGMRSFLINLARLSFLVFDRVHDEYISVVFEFWGVSHNIRPSQRVKTNV